MPSTCCEERVSDHQDKIIAVCAGLFACSLVLLAIRVFALDARVPHILIDDVLFGRHIHSIWSLFMLEAFAAVGVMMLLHRRPHAAIMLGLAWSTIMLFETFYDLFAFRNAPWLIAEEAAFLGLYAYLMGLLIVYARMQRRAS